MSPGRRSAPHAATRFRLPGLGALLRRDAVQSAVLGMGLYALSLLTGPLQAQALGAAGRGELAAVLVPTQLFTWLLGFGLPIAATYYRRQFGDRDLLSGCWFFALVAGLPAIALLWPLVPLYLDAHDPLTVGWFRAYLLTAVVAVPVAVSVQLLRLDARLGLSNALRALPVVLNTLAVVVLALLDRLTLTTALAAGLVPIVVSQLVGIAVTRGLAWPRLPAGWRATLLVYGAKVTTGTLAGQLLARLDQLLLVGLVPSRELGLYAVAVTMAGLSQAGAQGIGLALLTRLSTAPDPSFARRARLLTLAMSCTIALATAVAAPYVLPLLFGAEFDDAVLLLWLLLPGAVLGDLATVRSQEFYVVGRPQVPSIALAIAAAATVVSLLLTVGAWGATAAAITTSLCQGLYLLVLTVAARRRPPSPSGAAPDGGSALLQTAERTDRT
ncbi:MAG: rane protein involved in the export of O-antigen and teichoic acid [Frankiales bacterium]|nr:rane protein involved in the export of O-antigen and teichoic acid [Frankiales bacterium]